MHPELSKRLVLVQLKEALHAEGLFSDAVEFEEWSYPTFFIRFVNSAGITRLLRFECTNYDFDAIEVEPVDPISRVPLNRSEWVRRDGGDFPPHHMKDGNPFFCISGTRSYYTHESHRPQVTDQRWEKARPDFKIIDLIRYIKAKFSSGSWS